MNRGVVAAIAFAVLGVGAAIAVIDPSRGGQNTMIGFGLLAVGIVVAAILASAEDSQGSVRGDTHQEVHLHMPAQPQQQPQYVQQQYQPPAHPQIIYVPQPQPYYPPTPQFAPPQYAPHPGYLPAPPRQAYLPTPHAQHQAEYRGSIDVVAEPVHYAPPHQQRIARGAVPQLESPQSAGLIRRMARKVVG